MGLAVKRLIDVLASVIMLILGGPVMVLIALAIKVDSRGPIFYSQGREGWRGGTFNIYKFRTMVVGADRSGTVGSLDDPRVTRVGRWLRVNSLDELPQLLNVLKGEMSLVGPRPLLPGTTTQHETRRWDMRPGMTSLVEVSEPHLLGWDARMQLDIFYVDTWTIWQDLRILLRTMRVVFGRKDAVDPPRDSLKTSNGEGT